MRTERADTTTRAVARLDDPFHGFEVTLDSRDDVVVAARATGHRVPWNTCPEALGSVGRLAGVALTDARRVMFATGRSEICVHVNDLVVLAAVGHTTRRYEAVIDRRRATLTRDDDAVLRWPLDAYRIVGGPYDGLLFRDPRWAAALEAAGADADEREAVGVLRRATSVAMGYAELDWDAIRTGEDVHAPTMPDSCHTFASSRIAEVRCQVAPPRRRPA